MNCPKCDEVVEPDARFCGNCGQRLGNAPDVDSAQITVPAYALANPKHQKAESQSLTALLLAILSIPGAVISVIGLVLAVCGLIIATSVRSAVGKKSLNSAAIGFAVLGVVVSVGSAVFGYTYTARQQEAAQQETASETATISELPSPGASAGDTAATGLPTDKAIDTPCFRMTVPAALVDTVDTMQDNCSLHARSDGGGSGPFDLSNKLFAIDAASNAQVTPANLAETAQRIVGKNAGLLLPGYGITAERASTFAGSPAYIVDAVQTDGHSTVQIAVVLRTVKHGENIFIVGYGIDRAGASVKQFEQGWEWK